MRHDFFYFFAFDFLSWFSFISLVFPIPDATLITIIYDTYTLLYYPH